MRLSGSCFDVICILSISVLQINIFFAMESFGCIRFFMHTAQVHSDVLFEVFVAMQACLIFFVLTCMLMPYVSGYCLKESCRHKFFRRISTLFFVIWEIVQGKG